MKVFCAVLLSALMTLPASAAWPPAPVKIVVPYAPGGPGDTLGRLVSNVLEKSYKQVFYVENRPGAAGAVATLAVSRLAPNGQSLLIGATGSLAIGPAFADVGYHPMRDFSHIVLLGGTPTVLVVNASLPVNDLKDFIAYATGSKTGVSWASVGRGTVPYLLGEMFVGSTRLANTVHVDYKGDAPAISDLLGGHIQAAFMTLSGAKAHIKAGSLRALAISSARRNIDLGELPTFTELGYPELTATTWFCLSAPDGLPGELVEKLNHEVRQGFQQPEARKRLLNQDIEFHELDASQTSRFIESEIQRWAPVIRALESNSKALR